MTRTVADTAAALDCLADGDDGAWNVAPRPTGTYLDATAADPGRLRILICNENAIGIPPDPAVVAAVDVAATLLESLGHSVEVGTPTWPDAGVFLTSFLMVWSTMSATVPIVDEDLLEPHNRADRDNARDTDALAYLGALAQLQLASREFTAAFGRDFDVLVSPTMAVLPPAVGSVWAGIDDDPMAPVLNSTPMACYTAVYNVTGQPALSLPLHVDGSGVPIGVQFAAGPWQDQLLLSLGAQLETAAPWADRTPRLD